MSRRELVKRVFVPLLFPPNSKQAFLLAFEEWSIHRGSDEPTANS
jgi:hypothetical protein